MDSISFEEVSEFTPEIGEAIRDLTDQLDKNHQDLTDHDIAAMIHNPGTHLLIAKNSDSIVGMVTLIVYRIPFKMKAQIEDFVVSEKMRGKGIGTMLLKYSIEQAKKAGVKSLNLTSRPIRVSANLLYQKLGFEKRDTNVYRIEL